MKVQLSDELSEELIVTLTNVISDMSSEIADTDNPAYRRGLQTRRVRLQSIVDSFEPLNSVDPAISSAGAPTHEHP
jgi:hypothetical protein